MIRENVSLLRDKVAKAAAKSKYVTVGEVRIVCVTKHATVSQIKEVIKEGLCDLGENRLQDAVVKMEALKNFPIVWHMVGHLQSNKVKEAVGVFELIHSVDSLKLVSLIDKEAFRIGKVQKILLQVNTQRKEGAFGFLEEAVSEVIRKAREFSSVNVLGLMTIAPLCRNIEETRPFFRELRELKLQLEKENRDLKLPILSMGMSQDFEIAIEEGANMVRIGSAIFGDKK